MKKGFYDYSKPLSGNQASVFLINLGKRPDFDKISEGIREAAKKYGFQFLSIDHIEYDTTAIPSLVKLLIIVTDTSFDQSLTKKAIRSINSKQFTCVSIAFEYNSETSMHSYIEQIEEFKELSKDRINFLRPVKINENFIVPSKKIIDNSVCDSVRIKYLPVCLNNNSVRLNPSSLFFFQSSK